MYGRTKSKFLPEKPPWKPWALGGGTGSNVIDQANSTRHNNNHSQIIGGGGRAEEFQNYSEYQNGGGGGREKRVSFNLENLHATNSKLAEAIKNKNESVSKPLRNQFKSKPPAIFTPDVRNFTETQASYRQPGKERPIPLKFHGAIKKIERYHYVDQDTRVTITKKSSKDRIENDAFARIQELKSRILAGDDVSMTDITNATAEATFPYEKSRAAAVLRHHRQRSKNYGIKVRNKMENEKNGNKRQVYIENAEIPIRKITIGKRILYCEKGIVKFPVPHAEIPEFNTFGTPADLRISLSNSDTPEYQGRRRWFFDFTGFKDSEIRIYLEGRGRLVIVAERSEDEDRDANRLLDFIDLPKDVPADNLRIVRDVFGTLIVEEAWKFG